MSKIIILASGSGTNAENIIRFFNDRADVEFPLILSNRKDAYVHTRAKKLGIPSKTFNKEEFHSPEFLEELKTLNPDLIILAGFLWLIPAGIVESFPGRIINIHPALLPKYGGKGMYGLNVHRAVIENGEKESGITIHYVNERYDEGNIIYQAKCPVKQDDSPESLAERVHQLEYEY
ncbi:MAG: phosphoribosylglycinamide formyltransferase, partial [Bacteroidales bacterium]